MLVPGLLHGAYYAGALSTLHIKPADNASYFKSKSKISGLGSSKDLWAGLTETWFAPTQILVSYYMGQQTGTSSITLEVRGRDQFGYRTSERLTLTTSTSTSPAILVSRQGTRPCYVHLESMILVKHVNPDLNALNPLDSYTLGIGASGDDAAPFPPMEKNSYRVPLPVRLLDPFQVNYVHNAVGTAGTGVRDLWGYQGNLNVDLASNATETTDLSPNVPHPTEATHYIITVNRKRCFTNQGVGPGDADPCGFAPDPTTPPP